MNRRFTGALTQEIYTHTSAAHRYAREFVKDLEAARPRAILDLIYSAETFRIDLDADVKGAPKPRSCQRCGYICSQASACV